MKRSARWVLAVVATQAALVGLYWLVEHQRESTTADALGTAPPARVDMSMPPLTVRRRDGSSAELRPFVRTTIVHIWATWCPPCRAELPGLLELPTAYPVDVVAIALDERWASVERFLADVDASHVVLADRQHVARALAVTSLPVTFVVQTDGRITLRFDGARDWTDEDFAITHLGQADGHP